MTSSHIQTEIHVFVVDTRDVSTTTIVVQCANFGPNSKIDLFGYFFCSETEIEWVHSIHSKIKCKQKETIFDQNSDDACGS